MIGDILLKGGKVFSGNLLRDTDILIRDGVIKELSSDLPVSDDAALVDATSLIVSPGLVDVHVHFREPGFTHKETIRTGSLAAARGGYTTVCTMPNLDPVPDSPAHLAVELDAIRRDAVVDVLPYCSITKGRLGRELVDMESLKDKCVAFSDDGSGVQDDAVMLEAMRTAASLDCMIAAHCELNSLLKGGYINEGAYSAAHGHKGICAESEWAQIARDLELSAKTGCRYHVCHISTARSVALIREAKASGVPVTCETAPHYLTLCEDDLMEDGRFKMNPPLRTASDREALIEGFRDGTVDVIATDHAPHAAEEKSRGLEGSAMGIVGLETAFPVLYSRLVTTGIISLERLLDAMSVRPRSAFRIGGGLRVGEAADITLIDPGAAWTVDSSRFASMGHSTPFDGWYLRSRIAATMKNGKFVG